MTTHLSFCRTCQNFCPVEVEVEGGRVVNVTGDPANDIFDGYSCVKGRAQPAIMARPDRLLHSQRRRPDGTFEPISSETAMDEVAERLAAIVERHGPRSVAAYFGTNIIVNAATIPLCQSFMGALGSPMIFTPSTIDKPGKYTAQALHGAWMAGVQGFNEPDVALLVGLNPFQSYYGVACGHPAKWLGERMRAGMQLVVIDPRVSDIAKRATLHIQPIPGEDIPILASLLHVIIEDNLYDQKFVEENVDGLEQLREVVAAFTPDVVARRADVEPGDLVRAAHIFAEADRGYVAVGVGPGFSASSTLVNYLALNLDTLCSHVMREGERINRTVVLMPRLTYKAQAKPPSPAFDIGVKMRVNGLSESVAGLPTGALADEILLEGDGQVRALISCGGSPVGAWPDQLRAIDAMKALDLLVHFDPWMAPTARLAHYVIAPKMAYEVASATTLIDGLLFALGSWYGPPVAYAQYTPAIVDPPSGSDVLEEWEFFYGVAQRMRLPLRLRAARYGAAVDSAIDMAHKPTTDDLLELMTHGSRIPLAEVKAQPHGGVFTEPAEYVQPKDPGWAGRLDVANPQMMRDVSAELRRPADRGTDDFPFRLIGRRMQRTINSCQNFPEVHRGRGYNPAFMHPEDLAVLGLVSGDAVDITSRRATIPGVVEADPSLRRGLVAMTHGFGDAPDRDGEFREIGSPTGRLLDCHEFADPYVGMPKMGNVAVAIAKRDN
jgi:anaerobic selenocysteine-containing dehydrogenase